MHIHVARMLAPLIRKPTSQTVIIQLDSIRFIAALLVLVFHFSGAFAKGVPPDEVGERVTNLVRPFGAMGVSLFFVLSGYLLTRPFLLPATDGPRPLQLSRFYLRRLMRLYPAYGVNLVLMAIAYVVVHGHTWEWIAAHLSSSLLYGHGFVFAQTSRINYVAWSLEVEMQFYLLVPFAIWALRRARERAVACLALIAVAAATARIWVGNEQGRYALSVLAHLHWFCAGIILAASAKSPSREVSTRWDVLGLLAAIGFWLVGVVSESRLYHLLGPMLAAIILLGAMHGQRMSKALASPWLAAGGVISYTLYLYHWFVLSLVRRVVGGYAWLSDHWLLGFGCHLLAGIVAVVVISVPLFLLFEKHSIAGTPRRSGFRSAADVSPTARRQPAPARTSAS